MATLKSKKGLSLIGVLIATTLLSGSVIFIGRLLTNRSDVVGISRDLLIATNNAREGLELVRAVRDTNWIQKQEWTSGICSGAIDQFNTVQAQLFKRTVTIDCAAAEANPAFIIVTSTVSWDQKGRPRQVSIKEKLFNWLPV